MGLTTTPLSEPRHPEIETMIHDALHQYATSHHRHVQSGGEHAVVQELLRPLNNPKVRLTLGYAQRLGEDASLGTLRQHFVATLEDVLRDSWTLPLPLIDELIRVGGFSELSELFHARVQATTEV